MATYVDQAYYEWGHDDVTDQDESQGVSDSQMLDHGSISFGRFAYESLSWERWSVFTYNKCQEELEKFRCPGLVAKKKAYFEDYYKRIRAMKASQENQQTELTLDYGGDESVSSQTGEDETAKHLGNLGEEVTNIVDSHAVEASVEISTEKEVLEAQSRHSRDLEQEDYIKYPLRQKEVLIEISAEKIKEIVEVQNGHSYPEAILRNKSENIEPEDNTKYPLRTRQLDKKMQDDNSLMRMVEVPEQRGLGKHDKEDVSWESSIMPADPEGDPEATKLAKKVVSEKVMPHLMNHKAGVSVYKVKEPSATGRKASKSEHKTNPNIVKPSRGPKYASQRTTEKSGTGSSKMSADKVSRNIHSFSTAPSHRPLMAVRSSVTVPHPFSFATDRRAAILSGNREGPVNSDYKASNKKTSLTVHKKDAANVQASSNKTIRTTGAHNRVLENRRCHEERKKPLPFDKHRINLKDRGANVSERPKTRSINLPPRNNCSSSNGTEKRTKVHVREDGKKEQKGGARSSKVCLPPAGSLINETKKIFPSSSGNHSIKVRKLRSGEQSPDRKKPRQEKPRWR